LFPTDLSQQTQNAQFVPNAANANGTMVNANGVNSTITATLGTTQQTQGAMPPGAIGPNGLMPGMGLNGMPLKPRRPDSLAAQLLEAPGFGPLPGELGMSLTPHAIGSVPLTTHTRPDMVLLDGLQADRAAPAEYYVDDLDGNPSSTNNAVVSVVPGVEKKIKWYTLPTGIEGGCLYSILHLLSLFWCGVATFAATSMFCRPLASCPLLAHRCGRIQVSALGAYLRYLRLVDDVLASVLR
jgi:hypothetical protein